MVAGHYVGKRKRSGVRRRSTRLLANADRLPSERRPRQADRQQRPEGRHSCVHYPRSGAALQISSCLIDQAMTAGDNEPSVDVEERKTSTDRQPYVQTRACHRVREVAR